MNPNDGTPENSASMQYPSELAYEEYVEFLQRIQKAINNSGAVAKQGALETLVSRLDQPHTLLLHQTLCTTEFYGKDPEVTTCIDACISKLRDTTVEKIFGSPQIANEYLVKVLCDRYLAKGALPNKLGRRWCKEALKNHLSVLANAIYVLKNRTDLFTPSFFTRNRGNPLIHAILVCLIRQGVEEAELIAVFNAMQQQQQSHFVGFLGEPQQANFRLPAKFQQRLSKYVGEQFTPAIFDDPKSIQSLLKRGSSITLQGEAEQIRSSAQGLLRGLEVLNADPTKQQSLQDVLERLKLIFYRNDERKVDVDAGTAIRFVENRYDKQTSGRLFSQLGKRPNQEIEKYFVNDFYDFGKLGGNAVSAPKTRRQKPRPGKKPPPPPPVPRGGRPMTPSGHQSGTTPHKQYSNPGAQTALGQGQQKSSRTWLTVALIVFVVGGAGITFYLGQSVAGPDTVANNPGDNDSAENASNSGVPSEDSLTSSEADIPSDMTPSDAEAKAEAKAEAQRIADEAEAQRKADEAAAEAQRKADEAEAQRKAAKTFVQERFLLPNGNGMVFKMENPVGVIQALRPIRHNSEAPPKLVYFKDNNIMEGNAVLASVTYHRDRKEVHVTWDPEITDTYKISLASCLLDFGNGSIGGVGLNSVFPSEKKMKFQGNPGIFNLSLHKHPVAVLARSQLTMNPVEWKLNVISVKGSEVRDVADKKQNGSQQEIKIKGQYYRPQWRFSYFEILGYQLTNPDEKLTVEMDIIERRVIADEKVVEYPVWTAQKIPTLAAAPAPTPTASPISVKKELNTVLANRVGDTTALTIHAGRIEYNISEFDNDPEQAKYKILNYDESQVRIEGSTVKAGDRELLNIIQEEKYLVTVLSDTGDPALQKIARDLVIQVSDTDALFVGRKGFNNHRKLHYLRQPNTKQFQMEGYQGLSDATKRIYAEYAKEHDGKLTWKPSGFEKDLLVELHRTAVPTEFTLDMNNTTPVVFDHAQLAFTLDDKLAECALVTAIKSPPRPREPLRKDYKAGAEGDQPYMDAFNKWRILVQIMIAETAKKKSDAFIKAKLGELNPNWKKRTPELPQFKAWLNKYRTMVKDDYYITSKKQSGFTIKVNDQLTLSYDPN